MCTSIMKVPDMVVRCAKESWFKQMYRCLYFPLFPFYYVIMYYIIL